MEVWLVWGRDQTSLQKHTKLLPKTVNRTYDSKICPFVDDSPTNMEPHGGPWKTSSFNKGLLVGCMCCKFGLNCSLERNCPTNQEELAPLTKSGSNVGRGHAVDASQFRRKNKVKKWTGREKKTVAKHVTYENGSAGT